MPNTMPTILANSDVEYDINSLDNAITWLQVDDADGDDLTVILEVEGSLSLSTLTGLTFLEGDGTDDQIMSFTGSVADINAALLTLTYSPATDDGDGDTLQVSVSDGQEFTAGGAGTFPATLDLSALNGVNGLTVKGVASPDSSGYDVANVGDVNDDGIDDFLISAAFVSYQGETYTGQAYVVYGQSTGFSSIFELSDINGTNGFRLNQDEESARLGRSVSAAGDVNGDGITDLLVSAKVRQNHNGEVFVVYGSSSGFGSDLDVSSLNGANGFKIEGSNTAVPIGWDLDAIGDMNGDGFDDFVIGSASYDYSDTTAYVIFGSASGPGALLSVSDLNGTNGFSMEITKPEANTYYGGAARIADAGDFNGDGYDDIMVSAGIGETAATGSTGSVHVIYGTSSGFSSSFEFSDLNGNNGFSIHGAVSGDFTGVDLDGAGDFNGDGFDDLLIGANETVYGQYGKVHVVFGNSSGFGADFELSDLNGSNGFTIFGGTIDARLGTNVEAAGDLNNDGYADILVTRYRADVDGVDQVGESYVIFGASSGFSSIINLSDLNGTNGFAIRGISQSDQSGITASAAGDINNDGVNDLLIAAPSADPDGMFSAGQTYVVFGSAGLVEAFQTADIALSMTNVAPEIAAPATLAFVFNSNAHPIPGISVSDANDDALTVELKAAGSLQLAGASARSIATYASMSISTLTLTGTAAEINAALANLLYTPVMGVLSDTITVAVSDGSPPVIGPGTFPASIDLSDLDGSNGFTINALDGFDYLGDAVSEVGDFNGDGIDDFLVGATLGNTLTSSPQGEAYLIFGQSSGFSSTFELSDLDGTNGFALFNGGQNFGQTVSDAGDINNDGFADIIVGGWSGDTNGGNSGESHIIFGTSSGLGASLDVSSLNGTNGFSVFGANAGDHAGFDVSSAGDINGDGFDDIIIGARQASPNGLNVAGSTYVMFGQSGGFSASQQLSAIDGTNGFRLDGIAAGDQSSFSVSEIGDFNNDGLSDILIGAHNANSGAGEAYLVFGATTFASSFNLSSLNGANGVRLLGDSGLGQAGVSVASAGDVNGDGLDDLILGGFAADVNGTNSGSSYVVFGTTESLSATLELSSLNGTNGFGLQGIDPFDESGFSVSGAGDINNDGIDDLIVGAWRADPNGEPYAGETYVVFGTSSGFAASFELSDLDGSNGFALFGKDEDDQSGRAVSAAGDVNGDGVDDLLVGAPYVQVGSETFTGEAYVIFGRADIQEAFVTAEIAVNIEILPGDFDLDGTSDLMFQLDGGTTYSRLDDPSSAGTPSNEGRNGFESIGLADIDGDGVLDNVIRAANNNYVIQFSGENTGASTVGGNAFNITAFADIDGDGADEALGSSTDPADQRVYLIDDALQTVTRIGFNAHELIGTGDFDGDGSAEALLEQASGGKRLYDDSLGSVSVGRAILEAEAIGDFNGDGLDDVLTTHPNKNGHYYLLEGDAANPLSDASFIGYQSLELVAAGDFDGDGTLDILGNQGGTSFKMLTGGLTTLTDINFGNDAFEAIGDFNGDGMDDILLQRPNEQGRIVYSGDRNDTALINALVGKSVRDVADYDGDGSDDLLVQDDTDGSYAILLSGIGTEIDLDASLDYADIIDPNGIDTFGLI